MIPRRTFSTPFVVYIISLRFSHVPSSFLMASNTTRKNGSVPAEFQQNSVDVTSWFGTLDSDKF
jgi:hypothetical protein